MIVIGGSSRLGTGLDVREDTSDKKNNGDVRGEVSVTRINRCARENFISVKERKMIVMPERALIIVKYFVYLSLIAYAGFPVNAVTNPKGEIRVDVEVPKESEVGSYADLRCEWNLVGDKVELYSVKWYKDDHEFFRYLPANQGKTLTFPQQGVQLDKKVMSENSIRLTNLTLNSTGQYKCEVSIEGPSFATEYKTGNLTIIALPKRAPEITGLSSHYAVGENVTANCTAWPSIPKANLHWTINGNSVRKEYTVVHPPLQPMSTSGIPNSLGLRMDADARYFEGGDGSVSIRCVSYVGTRRMETEKTVHMAHVNNQRLSAGDLRGGGTSISMTDSTRQHCLAVILTVVCFCFAT